MTTDLLLRPAPHSTLRDVGERLDDRAETVAGLTGNLTVRLTDDPAINFRTLEGNDLAIPVSGDGLESIAGWVGAPWKFVKGLDPDLAEYLLNNLATRNGVTQVAVRYNDEGVQSMHDPHLAPISPMRYVEIAQRTISEDAPVDRLIATNREFLMDVVVPEAFDRGIGGDRAVGDITRGGLRFTQKRDKNMAPQVSPYLYRLVCTNGMELAESLGTVDSRGRSYNDVLAELEELAELGMSRLDHYIEQFYALRERAVANPERWLRRFGAERGLSNRIVERLTSAAPGLGDNPSEFDLVNMVTNLANDPAISNNVVRSLQQAGATVVAEHSARCDHCQSRLV